MRILRRLTEEEREYLVCEVFNCTNCADLYVTDDTEEGEGYICENCNLEDDKEFKK